MDQIDVHVLYILVVSTEAIIMPVWLILNGDVFTLSKSTGEDMCVLVSQSCLIVCDPTDCSPSGSSVHEILQASMLEWDLPNPGIEPGSLPLQADSLSSEPPGKPSEDVTYDLMLFIALLQNTML